MQFTPQDAEHYLDKFNETSVSAFTFITFSAMLLIIFIVRFVVLNKLERHKAKNKKLVRRITMYLLSHIGIEFLCAYIICFAVIVLTHANDGNHIMNFLIAPSLGSMIAIYIDNKIFIPLEAAAGIGSYKKATSNVPKESVPEVKPLKIDSNPGDSVVRYLDSDIADSDDFNTVVINTINEIKHENQLQNEVIKVNSGKLDDTVATLKKLQEAEMLNKKLELKALIYTCLNQGYVTPEQNDRVTTSYHSYISLGGNHEVESLYKFHYIHLPISSAPPSIPSQNVVYGAYDGDKHSKKHKK